MSPSNELATDLAYAKAKIVAPLRGLTNIPAEMIITACREAGKLLGIPGGEVSHQTIRNWKKILETKGPEGLDRKQHRNRGHTAMPPHLAKIAKGILLSRKDFSIAEAHRRFTHYARHHLNIPEKDIPSHKQLEFLWKHIPEEEKVLALKGMTAYRRRFDQSVRFEAPYPNAIWQADHHQLDIIVVDPETGKELGRPWITKIQDDHSRAIMGYYLSLDDPNSMSIASALYHAFLPKSQQWWPIHGLPEIIYIDNGKDWISRHIEHVGFKFGIKLLRHEPYHPQSKGKIERLFRSLEDMCIHVLDGYVGSNVQERPHHVTPKLTLEDLRTKIERFIRDHHERIHSSTKQKPRERWKKNLINHRIVEDLVDIDHLLKTKEYTVQKYGIHFQKDYYNDKDGVLGGYIGRRVTVFFDSRDLSRIRVWGSKNGDETMHYICTAHPQSNSEHRIGRGSVAAHNKQRRDATRKNVRELQKEGEQALKVLEEMEAQEEAAEVADVVPLMSEVPRTPSYKETDQTSKFSQRTRQSALETDHDEEPDYDELRRIMQRKQRERVVS